MGTLVFAPLFEMNIKKPLYIYKYHKINSYLFDLISNRQLWFSHQNELNDPYDCKYALSKRFIESLLEKSSNAMYNDIIETNPDLKTTLNKTIFMKKCFEISNNENWLRNFYNMLFGQYIGWSACCFTTNYLNEIMWAHYAEGFKGVCLEFNFSKTPSLHKKIYPVEYTDIFPEIESIKELPKALLSKRNAWKYEDEWRIISNEKGAKYFNSESLTAIYFGCKVKKSDIDRIRNILSENEYKGIALKQLNFRINNIDLELGEIKED